MNYNYGYRLTPTESQRETLDYHRDTCRQLYNHALYRFNEIPESEGTLKQRVRKILLSNRKSDTSSTSPGLLECITVSVRQYRDELPDLKDNVKALGKLKERGYAVGELRWKSPREFAVSPTTSLASNSTRTLTSPG